MYEGFDMEFWTTCVKCKEPKDVSEFTWNPDTWQPKCKSCLTREVEVVDVREVSDL